MVLKLTSGLEARSSRLRAFPDRYQPHASKKLGRRYGPRTPFRTPLTEYCSRSKSNPTLLPSQNCHGEVCLCR